MEYRRPITETFDSRASFRPSKVVVDNADNVYVCLSTITRGAIVFNANGSFRGYFGANRITRTADAILNYFLRFVLTREQMALRLQPVPVEFSNFTIDKDQFIYTVTATRTAYVDIVKKMNPAGQNVFENLGRDDWVWGAYMQPFVYNITYTSEIIDISVNDMSEIFLLDRRSGQVFHYNHEGSLMFIFGGRGIQKGLFEQPVAIGNHENNVYVLDSSKNSVTVFKLTEFGELVLDAMTLFNSGLYDESFGPWEEVLKRDANYYMAYIGMGNAMLSIGEFEQALDYFYMHSRGGYGRAFKDFRINYIRENFDRMLAIGFGSVGVILGGYYGAKFWKKRKSQQEQ
jgi:hypothetical protein